MPDNQTLTSGSTDGTIRLWDLATGQTKQLLRPKRPYEDMKIANIRGLTAAQKEALIALGASDESEKRRDKRCYSSIHD